MYAHIHVCRYIYAYEYGCQNELSDHFPFRSYNSKTEFQVNALS